MIWGEWAAVMTVLGQMQKAKVIEDAVDETQVDLARRALVRWEPEAVGEWPAREVTRAGLWPA